ncbi:MAG: symmetrical bis(5'-nucleosyl)-tetraphosphatase [Gammaproteobacteria bacterium]|nr:symmetrical bis(5'-nucleosyl)-tetraphosphatase [Gammaproteobacteria bacterium]MCD8543067.1 symmetrical bis(5'-nucleosyl)-tetraphosphatase [Gammaproteobacteria bacterium]
MATYAVGDIHGCFNEFQELLDRIQFDPQKDRLWLAGDLVNRGPMSLEVLRYVKALGSPHQIVLGNHDLYLLTRWLRQRYEGVAEQDALTATLRADDADELCDWLRHQPLLVEDKALGFMMVHAGFLPDWDVNQVRHYAREIEEILRTDAHETFLLHRHDEAAEWSRWCYIVDALTRLRYHDDLPWFSHPLRKTIDQKIVFGHWAALEGKVFGEYNVFALDTGCVWGGRLRAMRLEDRRIVEVASHQKKGIL